MHENRFNEYRIPSGILIVFLEKALTLIHMETHLDDVSHAILPHSAPLPLPLALLASARTSCCHRKALLGERDLGERFLNWSH
jgi:hypothetical protein